ncbi:MAG: ABC transporter ATP-binding protein [Myxococcales bacterium FL481]|nr:MAG: ABC transporter ATP-binding protein [Myxococcales bacterium FL481]
MNSTSRQWVHVTDLENQSLRSASPIDTLRDANSLRALELALGGIPWLTGRSLTELAHGLAPCGQVAQMAFHLSRRPDLIVRTGTWSAEEAAAAASAGAAVVIETPRGWMVLHRGVGSRTKVVQLDARRERRVLASVGALRRAMGEPALNALALEPRFGLEALSTQAGSRGPWARLLALMELERIDLIALVVYAVVLGALSLAVPVAVQVLVNTIALGSLLQPLVVLSVLLFGVLALSGVIQVLQAYGVEMLQRRIFVRVAEDFAHRLPNLRFDTHDRTHAPELTNRFFEVVGLQKAASGLLIDGLSLFLQTFVGLMLLAFYHPVLLAFDAALVLALLLVISLGYGAVASAETESKAKYQVAAWLQQVASHPVVFGRTAGNVAAATTADALVRDYLGARRGHFSRLLRQLVGGVAIQVLAMVGLLGLGGWLIMQGELTLGQLVAAELVVGAIGIGFAKSGKYFESGYDLLASLEKVGQVVDQPTVASGQDEEESPASAVSVELRGLTVERRDGSSSVPLTARIAPGERILVTGSGGTGKSALLETLAGLRQPDGGFLCLRDETRPALSPPALRRAACLVRGDAVVEATILENLRLGDLRLDDKKAWQLLERVGLRNRVAGLEDGLSTHLRPSGGPLSSSEVARLCLARAIASQPRLLLLDKVLDNLGLQADAFERVLDVVLDPQAQCTVVVVSNCDAVASRCEARISMNLIAPEEAA